MWDLLAGRRRWVLWTAADGAASRDGGAVGGWGLVGQRVFGAEVGVDVEGGLTVGGGLGKRGGRRMKAFVSGRDELGRLVVDVSDVEVVPREQ
ncbi:hypothetical protein BWQ96_03914 [Gracilariopsis chorda]|uniref:Uncharacterized protein n=1 Tax=Gracilariopsis chorda TaxID=448386 RepID=A0A2V3IVT5_9FLOR|nr:hypothetical protein BWQ96_03914 [Gracilariopsis chorda]|eukprot:PXF46258.1 hypothetical protein BWQ96_03914 [Gracilariopsis chorda]